MSRIPWILDGENRPTLEVRLPDPYDENHPTIPWVVCGDCEHFYPDGKKHSCKYNILRRANEYLNTREVEHPSPHHPGTSSILDYAKNDAEHLMTYVFGGGQP